MRHDLKKFVFVGTEKERSIFFAKAQEEGIIHFIDVKSAKAAQVPQNIESVLKAIKILRGLPTAEPEEVERGTSASHLVEQILALQEKLTALSEEERVVRLEKARVEPFGDFSLEDLDDIQKQTHRKVRFYCAKQGIAETLELPDVIEIASANGLDYFIAFSKEAKPYPQLIEMIIDQPWGVWNERYQNITRDIEVTQAKLKGYAKYNQFLHQDLIDLLNDFHLQRAAQGTQSPLKEGKLFSVEGWVPSHREKALQDMVQELDVYAEEIAVEPEETVPTFLENKGAARIGEDLVHIYDTPSSTDIDPSVWVLVFFALFFSMIIGDGGYGLVMLLVALYIRNKQVKMTKTGKRVLDLVTILSFSVIAWGVLTTSFFGIPIAPNSPLRKVSLVSWLVEKKIEYHLSHQDDVYRDWSATHPDLAGASNQKEIIMGIESTGNSGLVSYPVYEKFTDNIMMELALFVGVLHIILSMLRYIRRNPQNIGWIIFLIGAYLYAPIFLGAASIVNFAFGVDRQVVAQNAPYLMYGGAIIAVVIALFKHKWLGLLEATVVIQIFGDVLSYLRLYALGLSGSLLTATMNEMAASVPLVFAIGLLVIGHFVNMVLGVMGGVIHGLRLNFLEWYHYCFEGGGKLFNPLRKLDVNE